MLTGAVVVAATAADGPMIPAKLGAGAEIERSRSASWRSVVLQSARPRRYRGAAFGDAAVEHQRQVDADGFVGGGLADHRHELVDDGLDARASDVGACQCRADDRSDAAGKVAYDVELAGAAVAVPAISVPSRTIMQREL